LSSGNTMTVKLMYNQPYKIKNKAKLILTANKLPETTDNSYAFFERMIIVPFGERFVGLKKDSFLADKFKAELPGIFNILFVGYQRLIKQGHFSKSLKIDEEKSQYAEDNNPLTPWFEDATQDRLTVKPLNGKQDFAFLSDLYDDFAMWNQMRGNQVRLTHHRFSHFLITLMQDGNLRRARKRRIQVEGHAQDKNESTRAGFYDVVFHKDTGRQYDS